MGEEGCRWLAVGGGWNGNHPYLMSFSYFPGGVLKMAAWHASLPATWSLGFISITFFHPRTRSHPCHSPRPVRVTFTHIYSPHLPVSGNLDSTFDRSHLCSIRDPIRISSLEFFYRDLYASIYIFRFLYYYLE